MGGSNDGLGFLTQTNVNYDRYLMENDNSEAV
jgi:hypothetical protein